MGERGASRTFSFSRFWFLPKRGVQRQGGISWCYFRFGLQDGRKNERAQLYIYPQPHGNILSGDIPITPDRAVEFRESSKKESI